MNTPSLASQGRMEVRAADVVATRVVLALINRCSSARMMKSSPADGACHCRGRVRPASYLKGRGDGWQPGWSGDRLTERSAAVRMRPC
jgi:hypothetical protein